MLNMRSSSSGMNSLAATELSGLGGGSSARFTLSSSAPFSSGNGTNGNGNHGSAGINIRGRISSRFLAIDIKSPLVSQTGFGTLEALLSNMSKFYAEGFNGVPMVEKKWTAAAARSLLNDTASHQISDEPDNRSGRPGLLIALFDMKDDYTIAGLFYTKFIPTEAGVAMIDTDILMAPEYRKQGVGRELLRAGLVYAHIISRESYWQAPISTSIAQTYRDKILWTDHNWKVEEAFNLAATETLNWKPVRGVTIRQPNENELEQLLELMTNKNTHCSDGAGVWTRQTAYDWLHHLNDYNPALLQVAVSNRNGAICGLMGGDTTRRRGGPVLFGLHCWVKSGNSTEAIIRALTTECTRHADASALHHYRQHLTDIEVQGNKPIQFFEPSFNADAKEAGSGPLPFRADEAFIGLRGSHQEIVDTFDDMGLVVARGNYHTIYAKATLAPTG